MATPKAPTLEVRTLLDELDIRTPDELDLGRIGEHYGIDIRFAPLDGCAANIVGLGARAIITVDAHTQPGRQRFSTAHEIGHWIYDRGQGLYLCQTEDLNIPWHGHQRKNPREARANRFGAELLMPERMFRSEAKGQPISFSTVETLRRVFRTSRTATAIRLVELDAFSSMLICFGPTGRREWYVPSSGLPDNIYPHRSLPRDTNVFREIVLSGNTHSASVEVDGDVWIDHQRAFDFIVSAQGIPAGKKVLALVWWPDDQILAEISADCEEKPIN